MDSSRIDVKAWRIVVNAALACDKARRPELSFGVPSLNEVGVHFFYAHLLPFCRKYVRKFDGYRWEPWKAKPPSKDPDNPELREAINEILSFPVDRPGNYINQFYGHIPLSTSSFLAQVRNEESAAAKLAGYREPLYMHYEGTKYHVTSTLDGVSIYLEPHTADQTAYELAELLAHHPYLSNYL